MSVATGAVRPPRFGALRSRNFTLFWTGMLTSHTGVWMQTVAQGWLVYQLTNTPVWLGLTSLAFAIPMVVLPLFGGAVADRVSRRDLIRALQFVMAAVVFVLALLTRAGTITAWHLAAFSLIQGIVLAFDNPARHAIVPELVDRTALMSAISLFQSSYQLGGFLGPALAGVVLSVVGEGRMDILFALNTLTFLAFAGALSLIPRTPPARAAAGGSGASVADGVRFVWGQPLLRALLMLITIVGVFGRSYTSLLPVFARDILHTDAQGLSMLTAAPGIGVLVGATAIAAVMPTWRRGGTVLVTSLLFAVMLAAFTASRVMAASVVVLLLLGIVTITLVSAMTTAMQMASPDALRGRVMSLWSIANIGLPSMGAMLTASAAAAIGAPLAVAAGAVVVLLAAAGLGRRVSQL